MTIAEFIDKLHEAAKSLADGDKTELGAINVYSPSFGSMSIHTLIHDVEVTAKINHFGFSNITISEK